MGVDFIMQVVQIPPDGSIKEERHREMFFSRRLKVLEGLFRPADEGGIARKVRGLLPRPLSFSWFEKARTDTRPDRKSCWPPDEVVDSLESVYKVLKDQESAFPMHYSMVNSRGDHRVAGYRTFLDGAAYNMRGGWGRLVAIPEDATDEEGEPSREVDLGDEHVVRGHSLRFRPRRVMPPELETVLGPEEALSVVRESCFERYRDMLEEMVALCKRALEIEGLVFTYIST